jgi:hypothetical protein
MRLRAMLLLLASIPWVSCTSGQADDSGGPSDSEVVDADGDGFSIAGGDCNDADDAIYPGAPEACDGIDNDCDKVVDEDASVTWYSDLDSDGYGDASTGVTGCDPPSGSVSDATDCNDSDASVNPGASEACNGIDDDCDDEIDEIGEAPIWYQDADGDGFGDPNVFEYNCEMPKGYVADGTDCDDADASVNSGAIEVCNRVDDDCDGIVDGPDPVDGSPFFLDSDEDGYGDAESKGILACDAPPGYVADHSDCDDRNASINPGSTEICNLVDDDCDGVMDPDSASDAATWYHDADGDTYGDATDSSTACEAPADYVADGTDCDDTDAGVWPGHGCDSSTHDGTYTGTMVLDVEIVPMGIPDTCSASVTVTMDSSSSPSLTGTGTCTFSSLLIVLGRQTVSFDGDISAEPSIGGSVTVGTTFSDTWTGTFSGDDLSGTFEGSTTAAGLSVTYTGTIAASR